MPAMLETPVSFRQKLTRIDWALVALIALIACTGFAMLFSAAGGSLSPWADRQMIRFCAGLVILVTVACIDIRVWMGLAYPAYFLSAAAAGRRCGGRAYGIGGAALDRVGAAGTAALRTDEDRAGAGARALSERAGRAARCRVRSG